MTATTRGALLLVLSLLTAGASQAQPSYTEDFTTTTYRDDSATTAFWDTAGGQLKLPPFAPSIVGSYTSMSYARGADLAGDILYIADGYSGLRIFDVSDPTLPTLMATYNTPGYSVDNLAPGVPTGITAAYQAGTVALAWAGAPEIDFRYFRVYRGTTPGFAPSPGNLVGEVAIPAWTDQASDTWQYYYKVSAVDFAGNEGPAGEVVTASEVPGPAGAARFALQAAAPNPFNPATTISYSLARTGSVQLVIYDVSGRVVRTLVDDVQATGVHSVVWDGIGAAGLPVASGVYLYRLRAGGETEQKRMMLVK